MKGWSSVRNLPHDMWVLFYTTLINRAGTMVIPFLVLYLTQKIGVTAFLMLFIKDISNEPN